MDEYNFITTDVIPLLIHARILSPRQFYEIQILHQRLDRKIYLLNLLKNNDEYMRIFYNILCKLYK